MKKLLVLLQVIIFMSAVAIAQEPPPPPYPAAYWINGTLAANGAPGVSGYKVVFYKTSGHPEAAFASAVTDSTGKFAINALDDLNLLPLAPSSDTNHYYRGVVAKGGYGVSESELNLSEADLTNGHRDGVSLTLSAGGGIGDPDGGTVNITVKNAAGANIPGATVVAEGTGLSAAENANHTYTITNVPAGTYLITAAAANYLPNSTPATVNAGQTTSVQITLDSLPAGKAAIYGYVKDSSGNFLSGAAITAAALTTSTDTNGFYTLVVDPNTSYTVKAALAGYGGAEQDITSPATGQSLKVADFILTPLGDTGSISGAVTTLQDGVAIAIAGATVTDGTRTTFSNLDGTYTLSGIPAPADNTSVTLHAIASNYQSGTQNTTVSPNITTENVNFQLTPLGAGQAEVHGFVRKTDGTALVGATVSIAAFPPATAGSDGWYQLTVDAGTHTITASSPGYISQSESVPLSAGDAKTVDFVLETSTGFVQLTIERAVNDIKISWTTSAAPDIYYRVGDGTGQFTNQYANAAGVLQWTKIENLAALPGGFSHPPTDTEKYILHNNQVGKTAVEGANQEVYYKGLEAGLPANTFATAFPNAPAVGKVNVQVRDRYNSVCYPFNTTSIDPPTLMGSQLIEGDQIHWWDQAAQSYQIITKTGASWPATHTFGLGEGFFVYLVPGAVPRDERLTFVGLVGNFPAGTSKALGTNYTLFGYPHPVSLSATDLGLTPSEGDQLHAWIWDLQQFRISTFVGAAWNDLTLINFPAGEGKFYYTTTPYTWGLNF